MFAIYAYDRIIVGLAKILEQNGNPVDALIYPKLTSGTTHAGDGNTQRNYLLTLELIDVVNGKTDQVAERVRKHYSQ